MKTTKAGRREALRERVRAALRDLYHNATPNYPRDLRGRTEEYFQAWFEDAASFEIEYIGSGGAYGSDYAKTLRADCNAGRYKSQRARDFYVRSGMAKMHEEREHCGTRDDGTPNDALWERITEWGDLYQWGRGGRTLAPKDLISQGGGGSFSIRDVTEGLSVSGLVDLLRVLESFNRYVGDWCRYVPELWDEHCEAEDEEMRLAKQKRATAKAKETRERNYWASRDVLTV